MLISFTLENWMSFRDEAAFSMVASRERQHGERVARLRKYDARLLPIASIYGGNASGKTNFFKALSFVKTLVVRGTQLDRLIPVEPFRLDTKMEKQPSRFCVELLIDETIYEFSFVVTREMVLEEKLVRINSTREKVLYYRKDGQPNFHASLADDQFLQFAFRGTRENQLFLTNSVSQNVDEFRPVYNWFKDVLELIAPDSRFEAFESFLDDEHPLYSTMNETLPLLDTGIGQLGSEEVSFENLPIPDEARTELQEYIKEGAPVRIRTDPFNERYVITRKDGKLISKKLVTYRTREDGSQVKFETRQESDGTQRLIDLLPAFAALTSPASKKVFVIDEVDRSLHTHLIWRLLEEYLEGCSADSRTQLLITSHNVLLMDQKLLRRDEMWVAERDASGASSLFSFSEYKDIRSDKDIRKSYLQGRLGGIPRLLLSNGFAVPEAADERVEG